MLEVMSFCCFNLPFALLFGLIWRLQICNISTSSFWKNFISFSYFLLLCFVLIPYLHGKWHSQQFNSIMFQFKVLCNSLIIFHLGFHWKAPFKLLCFTVHAVLLLIFHSFHLILFFSYYWLFIYILHELLFVLLFIIYNIIFKTKNFYSLYLI